MSDGKYEITQTEDFVHVVIRFREPGFGDHLQTVEMYAPKGGGQAFLMQHGESYWREDGFAISGPCEESRPMTWDGVEPFPDFARRQFELADARQEERIQGNSTARGAYQTSSE